ncbi:MAG: hypothetical protein A2293_11945 [Elusimicrobia bacterium RIFOXYB2_FULL_49_7]|nr:MAG: hypothetical protein A2293_11945 [Elusimicrobia bacterium RIFOXYB2_FULL_49_7]
MNTTHKTLIADSRNLSELSNESVDLVITSPPYPMVEMWDNLFSSISPETHSALISLDGNVAFESMHRNLDLVWQELFRVLRPGSFACINIGDATRTIGERFQLYPNHARIIDACRKIGFDTLPVILWRKQTNAPNKFMGSGMLPGGAYVTLEHEYVLIFRKGSKREFKTESEKSARMRSSFFWEERNKWFSDVWDFKGASQGLNQSDLRNRSAAFPIELAYRLVNMYSLYNDVVLDPFIGTGTTALACIASGRNSIGIEINASFAPFITEQIKSFLPVANNLLSNRINAHNDFIKTYTTEKGPLKHFNENHGFSVMTRQESLIQLYKVIEIKTASNNTTASYDIVGSLNNNNLEKQKAEISNTLAPQLSLAF